MSGNGKIAMQNDKKRCFLSIGTVVVAVLLIIALIFLFLQLRTGRSLSSSVSTSNIIQTGSVNIYLDENGEESSPFKVENMFPGDTETKGYAILLENSGIKAVSFTARVTSENSILQNVLNINITVDGSDTALYSGALADIPAQLCVDVPDGIGELLFTISVSLDTSVGNEYTNTELTADFVWWVEDSDYISAPVQSPDTPAAGDSGYRCCPWCFGICEWCWIIPLLILIAIVIVLAMVCLVILRKNKRDDTPPSPTSPSPSLDEQTEEQGQISSDEEEQR